MRILYVGGENFAKPGNGAGMADAELCRALVRRGHEVEVVAINGPATAEGIEVRRMRLAEAHRHFQTAAPCVTIAGGQTAAALRGRPRWITDHGDAAGLFGLPWVSGVVACCEERATLARSAGVPVVVVHPIEPDVATSPPGPFVVVPGASVAKGADVAAEVARRLPDVPFLVVRTYGGVVDSLRALPNVTLADPMPPADLLAKMAVCLFPSRRENWPVAPRLAALHGRPVVARRLPGIVASTGEGAVYPETDSPAEWARAVRVALDRGAAFGAVPTIDREAEIVALEAAISGATAEAVA